jgi:sulfotransferase family protein
MTDDTMPPIFIVGCQRSGTTMLRLVLDSHPNISCGPETRFLADLAPITGDQWPRMSRYGMSKEEWHRRIADFFGGFQRDYAASRGKTRWADKTPRYALSLEFLDAVFPTCQIIHVIRDGRDVVASHRKRWGYRSAVKASVKWPRYIAAARAVGERLPPSRYLELRYEDLVGDTEKVLRGLFDWLGEPWDARVLGYNEHPHDVADRHWTTTAAERRAASGTEATIYRSRVGAYRRELNPLLRTLVRVVDGPMLRKLGY